MPGGVPQPRHLAPPCHLRRGPAGIRLATQETGGV